MELVATFRGRCAKIKISVFNKAIFMMSKSILCKRSIYSGVFIKNKGAKYFFRQIFPQ